MKRDLKKIKLTEWQNLPVVKEATAYHGQIKEYNEMFYVWVRSNTHHVWMQQVIGAVLWQ